MSEPMFNNTDDWSFEKLEEAMKECEIIGKEDLGLTWYPIQIEIVGYDEMLNLYSSHAMPLMYAHWSFGKDYIINRRNYQRGNMGLAFEIIQNTCPSIAYLMDTNSITMQTLVLAHASIGHNAFFKNNYMFKNHTDAKSILDYFAFAKNFIADCEEKYGYEAVEEILDCCHSLQMNSIDKYKRPSISVEEEKERQLERLETNQKELNVLWSTLPSSLGSKKIAKDKKFPEEPQENLLWFIEKYSPVLEPWEREIVRIVRKMGQYWYPNFQTKVINEGFATFCHYYIMNALYDKGKLDDGSMIEFLKNHTSVVHQPNYNDVRIYPNGMVVPQYSGINPYALGFDMFMDIKRICENPTEEDRKWFPEFAGTPWRETIKFAYENFRDESFIGQFLSPHLIRKWKFFHFQDHGEEYDFFNVEKIHNENGYKELRKTIAKHFDFNDRMPHIEIVEVDMKGDRSVKMTHYCVNEVPLNVESMAVLKNFVTLWGFDATVESVDENTKETYGKFEVRNNPAPSLVPATPKKFKP